MTTPYLDVRNIPCLAGTGATPLLMTGVLLEWLRQHYSTADRIEDSVLRQEGNEFIWKATADSELLIESATKFDVSQLEKRPAVIVKRLGWQTQRIIIGHAHMGVAQADGSRHYTAMVLGGHTVFCLSGEGGEAEKLAGETYYELLRFAPLLRRMLDLKRLEIAEVGEVAQLEEATENYVVPITLSYAFTDSWKIAPQNAPVMNQAVVTI